MPKANERHGASRKSKQKTTTLNLYFANDSPEKKEITIKLIDKVISGEYAVYVSPVLFKELNDASEEKRFLLLGLLNRFETTLLELT